MSQSARQIKQSRRLGAVNNYLLIRIEETGVEIEKARKDDSRIRVSTKNPLEKMRDNGKLTRQECAAGQLYQKRFGESNLDGFSKPCLVYEGLPDSARSTKPFEPIPTQERIDATRYLEKVKTRISYHIYIQLTIHKIKNHKLFDIIKYVFEEEKSIRYTERKTGINHADIEDRVKEICGILLEIK